MSFSTFCLDFEEDLPALNCVDLFPNPPTQQTTNEPVQHHNTESTETGYKTFLNSEWDWCNQSVESNNCNNTNMSTNKKPKGTRSRKSSQSKDKFVKIIVLPTPSPSPSVTSNCSSVESLDDESGTTNLLKRKKKRLCKTCNTQFRRTKDFMSHLRGHVTMPMLVIKKLNDDNKYVAEYLQKIRDLADNNCGENSKDNLSKSKDICAASGGLKLKLKISGSNNHNFHVVRDEKEMGSTREKRTEEPITEEKQIKGGIRVLRADEIKQSKSPPSLSSTTPPVKMLENMQVPNTSMGDIKPIINPTANRYFECPTLDGLDQFSGEVSSETTEDLLQKLLHCNQTDMNTNNPEMDWSANSTPSEFISIDRLGHICNVCNANFVDNMQLYEHKRITGHDCMNPMNPQLGNPHFPQHRHPHPMHPMNMHYGRGYPGGMVPPPSGYSHPGVGGGMVRHNGVMYPHNEAQMHLHQQQQHHMVQIQGYTDRPSHYMMPSQQLHPPQHHQQDMISRRPPPPLYRVPGTQLVASRQPGTSFEQHMMQHEGYPQNYPADNDMSRPGQFLKAKMQKAGYPGVGGPQTSSSPVASPSPPMVMGQQTSIRPKFLSPPVRPMGPISRTQPSQGQSIHMNRPVQTYAGPGPRPNGPTNSNRPIPGSQAPPLAKLQNPMQRVMGPASRVAGPSGVKIIQNTQINKMPAPGPGNRMPGVHGPREVRVQNASLSRQPNSPQNGGVQPPQKKIRLDGPETRNTAIRSDGFPVIKSVVGGAVKIHSQSGPQLFPKPKEQQQQQQRDSPIQFNDQITLSLKNREAKKNPKEVASILATRGIIVTQKSGKAKETTEPSIPEKTTSATQEAVQKLQLNNSVSIISKKKPDETSNNNESDSTTNSNTDPFISCPVEGCEEKFLSNEMLSRHTNRDHKNIITKIISAASLTPTIPITNTNSGSSGGGGGNNNVKAFKCKFCPALFSSTEGLQDHQWKSHKSTQASPDELGIPIIDLKNEDVKKKLSALGITNYIPLNCKTTNNCYGFPIVSVQGASNTNICNLLGLGATSLLSLGPIKHIQKNPQIKF